MTIWTDASEYGWGAFTEDCREARGIWSPLERTFHINVLEIRAITKTMTTFSPLPTAIQVATDNACAVAATRKHGSRNPQIQAEVSSLLARAVTLHTFVSAYHIAGPTNVVADSLSRPFPLEAEWELPKEQFRALCQQLGTPQVDLFTSPRNNQLPTFVFPFAHPRATAVDALAISWSKWDTLYLFPPPALLLRVAQLLEAYQGSAILIAPDRPTAPWFPLLHQICQPVNFSPTPIQWVGATQTETPSTSLERWIVFTFCAQYSLKHLQTAPPPR